MSIIREEFLSDLAVCVSWVLPENQMFAKKLDGHFDGFHGTMTHRLAIAKLERFNEYIQQGPGVSGIGLFR